MAVTTGLLDAQIDTTGATIGTRVLSAAVKSGTAGGVFGALQSPGDDVIQKLKDGRQITGGDLLERTLTGGVTGFVGGSLYLDMQWTRRQKASAGSRPTGAYGRAVRTHLWDQCHREPVH